MAGWPGLLPTAQLWAWAGLVGLAAALLTRVPLELPGFQVQLAAVGLCLPAIWLMPLPHKAIPVLLAAGLGLQLVPLAFRWPRRWGRGAAAASLILLAQSLTVWLYEVGTRAGTSCRNRLLSSCCCPPAGSAWTPLWIEAAW